MQGSPSRPGLRRLVVFDAVVRCGSIGAAAKLVGLSQPAVTHALARLEGQTGSRLLDRGPGGSVPSAAGAILHRRVERMTLRLHDGLRRLSPQLEESRLAVIGRRLTDTQLRGHIAVARSGTFRAAAAALRIAEPTLHRTVRGLEAAVAAPLYRRTPSGIGTTPAGDRFAVDLRVALREIDQALDELAAACGRADGRVTIGCLPLMPKPVLARAVGLLLRRHPTAALSLEEGSRALLVDALLKGDIDMILGALHHEPASQGLHELVLFPDPYVVVVSADHPLTRAAVLDEAALADFAWVIPWRGTPRRDALEALFARLPRRPQVALETSSPSMMGAVLAESGCVALLSRSQVGDGDGVPALSILPVALGGAGRAVGITTRADWLPTSIQLRFMDLLQAGAGGRP